MIQLFCYEFNLDVCIHHIDDKVGSEVHYRVFCGLPDSRSIHLRYNGVHYDVLDNKVLSGGSSIDKRFRVVVSNRDLGELLRTERDCVFAHCISANFGDQKHMSAGVATVFIFTIHQVLRKM